MKTISLLATTTVIAMSVAASPVAAQPHIPNKLVSKSGATYLLRQDDNGDAPSDVKYVYRGKVRDPQSNILYDREYWFKSALNDQLTGSFKEEGNRETCYALATLNTKNFSMRFTYLPRAEGNQNCSVAGQTFATQLLEKPGGERPATPSSPSTNSTATDAVPGSNATIRSDTTAYETPSDDSLAAFSLRGDERVVWKEERAVGRYIWFRIEVLRNRAWKSAWLRSEHVNRD